ncbi:hypothetical protein JTB14_030165 [Gonioctena quinquepunctata]|nr:hypothetical protein JTB14_030165 [Gonioctena quinquepunctata]
MVDEGVQQFSKADSSWPCYSCPPGVYFIVLVGWSWRKARMVWLCQYAATVEKSAVKSCSRLNLSGGTPASTQSDSYGLVLNSSKANLRAVPCTESSTLSLDGRAAP